MTGLSTVKVHEAKSVPRGCKRVKIDGDCYLEAPTLFDCGTDGGAATEALANKVSFYTLKSRNIAGHTVNGTLENNHKRRKIKIRTYKGVIRNYDMFVVKKIGKEEAKTKSCVQMVVGLFQMKEAQKEYFLNKVSGGPMEKHLIFLRSQSIRKLIVQYSSLATWVHPGNKGLIIIGKAAISSELFDADSPTFYVYRSRIGQLKEEY